MPRYDTPYNLTIEQSKKASEEKIVWEERAVYWHNAIPNFDYDIRSSLTKDVQTAFTFEQLALNKELQSGIKWSNKLNIIVSVINLILLVINIALFFSR